MYNPKETEEKIFEFWEKNKILEKLRKKNEKGKKFYFLQGPPYTSGKIHIGHAWNNSLKDMIMRYKRFRGFNVWDRAGYDMHGLPTENAVQKKLKFKNKEEIERFGVDKFVKACMDFSIEHAQYMNQDLAKLGIWMDYKNAYMPVKKEFISGQWAFFKKAYEQGRLYKGMKVMHWDAETETSLAKHELEYETITDTSVYLKFKIKNKDNEYFVIWTTTPWTIPYNLAIMVNPSVDYVKLKAGNEIYILAEDLAETFAAKILEKEFRILDKFKGVKLDAQEYIHPFYNELKDVYDDLKERSPRVHTVILNKEYVNTEAGTGLVHSAPGCGPEDQEACEPYDIKPFNTLNEQGVLENLGKYSGWKAKDDDNRFIEEFDNKGVLLGTEKVRHEYPHSWRSHKPVVFRTTEQWFLKTKDLSRHLLKYNKEVHWVPKKAGESHESWTENLKDNGVTRQRYWGCPVPIWINEKDEKDFLVIGSTEELEKSTGKKLDDLSSHRPWIDNVLIKQDGKVYKRIPDVADVWIDSGTASWNCLYNDPKLIEQYFPADLVLEATEQTHLWFSLLQICSAVMFDKTSFENAYVHGMILDYQGTKMSKSLGNVISPYEVIDKYSADIFRYYMCQTNAGENINFNWEDIKQKQRNLIVLENTKNYLLDLKLRGKIIKLNNLDIEELYFLSKTNSTLKKVTDLFNDYELDKTIGPIEDLFLELSRTYIKLTRDKSNNPETIDVVLSAILDSYKKILIMFSTICPFITESIWQDLKLNNLVKEESIFLADWPEFNQDLIDENLENGMEEVKLIIQEVLAQRDKEKIGVRWPLPNVLISTKYPKALEPYTEVIKTQVNVKQVTLKEGEHEVTLDTKMTEALEHEGYLRELTRKIQELRKKAKLNKVDKISLVVVTKESFLKNFKEELQEKVNAKTLEITLSTDKSFKFSSKEKIKDKEFEIGF